MRFIVLALVVHTAHSWRPLGQRDPLSDPTHEYSPPVTSGVQYWAPEPPSVRLEPPPPARPLPWLLTVHLTTAYPPPASAHPPLTSAQQPLASSQPPLTSTAQPPSSSSVTEVVTTTTDPTAFSAVVIQGHSKVKKYGPVEGSINSVLHQSGKPL